MRGHGMAPAPKRSQTTSWKDFISAHKDVLAGTDFFTVEVLSWRGLVTYYLLSGKPPGQRGADHKTSGPRVDGTDRS